jgi:NRPS condensation-like uncharacterized protein
MKNFFVIIASKFLPTQESYSREEVLKIASDSLKEQMDPQNLDNILSYNVSNEQNRFLRPIPIFIKNIAIKHVYMLSADTATSTMTNVGNIEVKEQYKKYIEHFYGMLSMSRGQNIKAAIASYNGTLIVTFTSCLTDVSIQKRFFQSIAKDGVEAALETNEYMNTPEPEKEEPRAAAEDGKEEEDGQMPPM